MIADFKLLQLSWKSLAFRLFFTAILLAMLFLPLTAYILLANYKTGVEEVFDDRLNDNLIQLYVKLDRGEIKQNSQDVLPDPRFNVPLSGWYWQITSAQPNCGTQFKSESLTSEELVLPSAKGFVADDNQTIRATLTGPSQENLRILERSIKLSHEKKNCQEVSLAVAGDAGDITKSINAFRLNLFLSLGFLGLGLAMATFFQVRYGLAPLRQIRRELAQIRSGERKNLEGDVPDEIEPLKSELNALIASNQDIIERARMHVGNLAHALKTPLSVITNEAHANPSDFSSKVSEQATIMSSQISHHLDRARMVARVGVIGSVVEVKQVLDPLVRVISRINEDKGIDIISDCPSSLKFQGEKQDLEEMVGNLLDNAGKWAEKVVILQVRLVEGEGEESRLKIIVEDDGPGLKEDQLATAIQRGKRLDETKPGSGLGLSIVAELAELYKGRFYLEKATPSGLRAVLELPAA